MDRGRGVRVGLGGGALKTPPDESVLADREIEACYRRIWERWRADAFPRLQPFPGLVLTRHPTVVQTLVRSGSVVATHPKTGRSVKYRRCLAPIRHNMRVRTRAQVEILALFAVVRAVVYKDTNSLHIGKIPRSGRAIMDLVGLDRAVNTGDISAWEETVLPAREGRWRRYKN